MKTPCVYILSSPSRVLYIGVTSDLPGRLHQHRQKLTPGFTTKYNVTTLVWYETFPTMAEAIAVEKQLKGWRRERKLQLIFERNPRWEDLSSGWNRDFIVVRESGCTPTDPSTRSG